MKRSMALVVAAVLFFGLAIGTSPANAASVNATIVQTDTLDYAPGDSVIITGTGYWPGESIEITIVNVYNPGLGEPAGPWTVTADAGGNFETYWIVSGDGVDQTYLLTARGMSSGIVSTTTFSDSNTKIRFATSFGCDDDDLYLKLSGGGSCDTFCPGQQLNVCAYLAQLCGSNNEAPLANRLVLFFINPGNCGANVAQNANDSVLTDVNGLACANLTLPTTPGEYSIRIKFRGEAKPSPSDPPNSACDPTQRVQLSAANDCQTIQVAVSGTAPVVTLPPDTTIRVCSSTQVCLPVLINDNECDVASVTSNVGTYGGTQDNFDYAARLSSMGGSVTQVGGGQPGKILYQASDFVPPVNTQSGVAVTLPNFIFASSVVKYGSFPSGIGPAQSADQMKGSPTDLTFTLPGAGGPDAGNGDGSVDFATGNWVTMGFAQTVRTCDGSNSDFIFFSNTNGGGTAQIVFKKSGTPVHVLTRVIPGGTAGSGTGGVVFDLPDGIEFNQVYIKCVSGTIEADAFAARILQSSSTRDICFTADTTGVYTVIVTATDRCGHVGADTTHVTIAVNRPPVANAGADFTRFLCALSSVCFNVSFSDPDNNLMSKLLISGPGTLTGNQICFTPSTPGTSTFVIKAIDSCGLYDLDTVNVTIGLNAPPVANNPSAVTKFLCSPTQLCHTFTATDPNGGPLTWTLLAGAGSITSGGQYCFTPSASGSYSATVAVSDSCGTKDTTSISYTITLNSAPVAINPTSPATLFQCAPTQVCYQFTAGDANGGTLTWTKLSGVGTVTSGGNWCFTPSGTGSFGVTVKVADSCGAADTTTLTYNVTINSAPSIAFGADTSVNLCTPQQICFGYAVSDPDGLAGLAEYMLAGFGAIDTANNQICFTPNAGGTYQFIVNVTDPCGAVDYDTAVVTVVFGQIADIACPTEPINVTLCATGQVCQALTVTPSGATVTTSYGSYSGGQLCFQADTAGTYVIRVIAANACGADTCDVTFLIDLSQPPNLVCPDPQTRFICQPGTVCIPVGGAPIATWTVTPIGSYSSGNVCFPADTSGHYVLKVKATTPCGTDSCFLTVDVTINTPPVAVNPPTPIDTFICGSSQLCYQFSASDVNGGTLIWSRITGTGSVSATGQWCFTASASGSYSVLAAVADSCGAADTVILSYNVTMNSAPVLALGNDTTIFQCAPAQICLPFTLSDIDNNQSGVSLISGTGTISVNPNQLCFTPSGSGAYTFIAEAADSCGATDRDTIVVTVHANNPPVVNAGADQTVFQCSPAQICWPASGSDPDGNLVSVVLITGPGTFNGSQICFTPTGTLNYEFVLKATDACGAVAFDTVVVYYTLNSAPVASAGPDQSVFQCTPTQICWPAGGSDVDGNLSGVSLISGPGSLSSGQICFTPTTSGAYMFVVQTTDACGASDLDTAVVTVTLNSAPVCVVPNDTLIFQCTPTQVCLPAYGTDPNGNLNSCQIISGPGTLSGGNWCYTPIASQVVTVTLRCEDSCNTVCESQFAVEFKINRPPTIAFADLSPQFICASQQLCVDYSVADPDDPQPRTVTLVSGPGTLDTANTRVCFTAASSGVYTFVIRVDDQCGAFAMDTTSVTVTLNSAPVANAGPNQTVSQCTPTQICWPASCSDVDNNLTGCSLAGPGTYTGSSICFTPSGSGVYQFILTASDYCGLESADTVAITVTVNSAPQIAFGADTTLSLCTPQAICLAYVVTDANGLSGLTEYQVSGPGTIDTAANKVCFTPSVNGTYQIIVGVVDPCGATDVDTIVVHVSFGDVAMIGCSSGPITSTPCSSGTVCQSLSITPTTATVTTSYGTYTGGQLCFMADTSGTYHITVIANAACGADTCQLTFNVNIGGAPQLTCPAPQSKFLCSADTICVAVGVVGNDSNVVVTPIGSYAAGEVCFPADSAGHYVLTVIATTGCGADTCQVVVDVTMNLPPIAIDPRIANPTDTFLCGPAQICFQFDATDPEAGPLTWTMISGDGTLTPGGLWCFTAPTAGNYSIVAAVEDSCGAADTTTLTYHVTMNYPPIVSLGNDLALFQCASAPICFPYTVSDPDNNITLEELIAPTGTIDTAANQVCFTPAGAGIYTFIVKVTDGCGVTDADTIIVTVNSNRPPVAFAGADQSLFRCLANEICWPASATDPDGNLDTAYVVSGPGTFNGTSICFTPTTDGVYAIVLLARDDCGLTDLDTVVITVNLNEPPICQMPPDTSTFFQCAPTQVSLTVGATDPDGNFDHCEIVSGPGSIVGGNWVYTPSVDEFRKVVVMCVDQCGATCTDSFFVRFNINAAPVVNAGKDSTYFVCGSSNLCWPVTATDEDNNLSLVELISPVGSYNASTHQICFTVPYTNGPNSVYTFIMKATDACGAVDYDTANITVDFNNPPVVTGPPNFTAYLDQVGQLCFDVTVTDPDNNLGGVMVSPIGSYNATTHQVCFPADTTGHYCLILSAWDGCTHYGYDTVCIDIIVDQCIHVQIEKVHDVPQGQYTTVGLFLNGSGKPLGGFNFLIAYDPSALIPATVDPGTLFTNCGWEYFTYRYGSNGNCGTGCPNGLVRIVGVAETNNGAYHPGCYFDGQVGTIAVMSFLVSNDRTLECQYSPIRFFWEECGDNSFSNRAGDTLWVERKVFDFELNNITNHAYGLPGYFGIPDLCLVGGGPGKPAPQRCIDFTNGGVDIICADSIDARGDINLNGLAYEVADAVMFTNYFIHGLSALGSGQQLQGAIAASDVNADGLSLSVADLVYLIRVVVGDAPGLPKPNPTAIAAADFAVSEGVLNITRTDEPIGAVYVLLPGEAHPVLHEAVANMEMKYHFDGTNTRVLIANLNGKAFLGEGPVLRLNDASTVKTVEIGSYDGAVMVARVNALPETYALSQNYPNPFNPVTTIEFALPKAGEFKLVIYNILGQEVAGWSDKKDAGYHKLEWDARTHASGVYFYRLTAGEFSATRKMVLLK